MFFSKEIASANFSVSDISYYCGNLRDATDRAVDCYNNLIEWSERILAALYEIIEVGTHNAEVCQNQINACEHIEDVADQKLNALCQIEQQLENAIRSVDESISRADEAYRKACEYETRVRNSTAQNEQEAKMRQQAISSASKMVSETKSKLSKLREKRSRLYNMRTDIGQAQGELNNAKSHLYLIKNDLNNDLSRIRRAVDTANDLVNKLKNSVEKLKKSFQYDINGGLYEATRAANKALSCARAANDRMCELNDKSYSDSEQICVTDINGLRNRADRMHMEVDEMINRFQKIYGMCNSYEEILQDDIMESALDLVDTLSESEKHMLQYIAQKSNRLDAFADSLRNYYSTKM